MNAIKTSLRVEGLYDLPGLRQAIEEKIPVGFHRHETPIAEEDYLDYFPLIDNNTENLYQIAWEQIGTLGGGNHFIEVSYDTEGIVWLMWHSGSRRIGKEIADYHINVAKSLPGAGEWGDLAPLYKGTKEFKQYIEDAMWAQNYASINRYFIGVLLQKALYELYPKVEFDKPITCHHNFIEETQFYKDYLYITRKGAIRADKGKLAIIPGSMGTASYIVEGLGNSYSFYSASHGAGRKMSRSKAKKTFTEEDINEQLEGIESRRDCGILDELPGAYKDIYSVMEQQKDLVTPVTELHQLISIKG